MECKESAPIVVFVHGLFGSQHEWQVYKAQFAPVARILTYELPQHGLRAGQGELTQEALLEDFEQWLILHTNGAQILLVGHSLGGLLGLQYAVKHCKQVRAIVLLDILPLWSVALKEFQKELLAHLRAYLEGVVSVSMQKSAYGKYMQKHFAHFITDLGRECAYKRFIHFVELYLEQLYRLAPLPMKIFLIRASNSFFAELKELTILKKEWPQFSQICIEGAGHMLHLTHRGQVLNALQCFLLPYFMQ